MGARGINKSKSVGVLLGTGGENVFGSSVKAQWEEKNRNF
jgi:hypothetical protein